MAFARKTIAAAEEEVAADGSVASLMLPLRPVLLANYLFTNTVVIRHEIYMKHVHRAELDGGDVGSWAVGGCCVGSFLGRSRPLKLLFGEAFGRLASSCGLHAPPLLTGGSKQPDRPDTPTTDLCTGVWRLLRLVRGESTGRSGPSPLVIPY